MKTKAVDVDLTLDPFAVVGIITGFLVDQFKKKGFCDAVIGLSGGVDSALGAALAAEALGARHVTALAMPAGQSNPRSLADARAVAETLGIALHVEPIGPVMELLYAGHRSVGRVRRGNAAARLRMVRLFDYSYAHHALVIGTSNKSELLLGYGTWYGDLACAINPIGDLYKTQVWQLADFMGVPETVIAKPPSADLWRGQTDEAELGFSYDEVDRLLHLMIDREYTPRALVARGFAKDFVRRVHDRVIATQFKRSLPTIPKISSKTIGIDFHLSRDWGT